jgi:hypothetical protein
VAVDLKTIPDSVGLLPEYSRTCRAPDLNLFLYDHDKPFNERLSVAVGRYRSTNSNEQRLVKNGLPFRIAERCGFLLRSPRRVSFSFPTKKAPLKGIKRSAEYSTLRNTRQSGEKVEREPARKDGRGMKSSDLLPAFLNGNGPNRRIRLVR